MALREIDSRITAMNNLEGIMIGQASVSTMEILRTQNVLAFSRNMFDELAEPLDLMVRSNPLVIKNSLLTKSKKEGVRAFVVIGTDRPICGLHNEKLLYKAVSKLKERDIPNEQSIFFPMGRRIAHLLEKTGQPISRTFPSTSPKKTMTVEDISPLYGILLDSFLRGECHSVDLIYYKDSPDPIVRQLLPILIDSLPVLEKSSLHPSVEPQDEIVSDWLLRQFFILGLYNDFLTSALQEFQIRLEIATQAQTGIPDLIKILELEGNTIRLAKITDQIRELEGS
jgi:ATP synthase F1 gamma subunit